MTFDAIVQTNVAAVIYADDLFASPSRSILKIYFAAE